MKAGIVAVGVLVLGLLAGCGGEASTASLAAAAPSTASPRADTSAAATDRGGGALEAVPAATRHAAPAAPLATAVFGFRPHRQYLQPVDDPAGIAIVATVAALDINGDHRMDLVTMSDQGWIGLFLQRPDGRLAAPLAFRSSPWNYSPENRWLTGDFNEDGILDFLFDVTDEHGARGGVGLLLSRRGASPVYHLGAPSTDHMAADGIADMVALDMDGDGHEDLVRIRNFVDVASTRLDCSNPVCPSLEVLHGDGRGNFGRPSRTRLGLDDLVGYAMAVDVDEDAVRDLVVAANKPDGGDDARLLVAYGRPRGGLGGWHALHGLPRTHPFAFGDFDGDGLQDTVARDGIHFRTPDGSFSGPWHLEVTESPQAISYVHVADFDGDGVDDLVKHLFRGFRTIPYLAVYMGGNGILQPAFEVQHPPWDHAFPVASHRFPYASGDFNGDGCTDLAVAVGNDGLAILDGENCVPRRRATAGPSPRRLKR